MRPMLLAAAAALATASIAGADPSPSDLARAKKLFGDAMQLAEAGQLNEACAKYEESLAIERSLGTLLNVARCHARAGATASASALYEEAAQLAKEKNQSAYFDTATEQHAMIAPLVPHLAIVLSDAPPGTTIAVDGKDVPIATIDDVPVDPGAHVVRVAASGYAPYDTTVTVEKSEHKRVVVPALAGGGSAGAHAGGGVAETVVVRENPSAGAGKLIAAGGVGVLVAGATVGVLAKLRYNDALKNDCGGNSNNCTPDGFAKTSDARSFGNLGTYVGVTGAVVGGVGVAMWLATRHHHESRESAGVSFAPMLAPGEAGAMAFARF